MLIGGVQPRSPISANLGNLRWEGTITTGDWLLAGGAMDVQGQVQEQGQAGPRDDVATGFSQGRRQRQTQPAGDPGLADALPLARTQTNPVNAHQRSLWQQWQGTWCPTPEQLPALHRRSAAMNEHLRPRHCR